MAEHFRLNEPERSNRLRFLEALRQIHIRDDKIMLDMLMKQLLDWQQEETPRQKWLIIPASKASDKRSPR